MIHVVSDIDFTTSPIHNNNGGKLEFHSRRPEKKLFQYRNSKFAGEFKTRAMAETTSLSSTPLLEPKLSTSSSKLNKNEQVKILKIWCVPLNL